MTRLLVLYNQPTDAAAFDVYYRDKHIPLAKTIPGVRSCTVSAQAPGLMAGGPAPYLVAELDFDSPADFQAALASPEGQATAADLAALPVGAFAWVLLGGYATPEGAGEDVFGDWLSALPRETRLMFDPTPLALRLAPARLAPALARADWVSANASEARALTGFDPPRAAEALAQGRLGATVRDGAAGSWLAVAGEAAAHVAGFPVEAVDATGAGDTHNGAFIAARLAGKTPLEAARFANAAAALSVLRLGAATAPSLAETLGFLGARG